MLFKRPGATDPEPRAQPNDYVHPMEDSRLTDAFTTTRVHAEKCRALADQFKANPRNWKPTADRLEKTVVGAKRKYAEEREKSG